MTIEKLMALDQEFCEAVSKQGAKAWGKYFAQTGVMLSKDGENVSGEPAVYLQMKNFFDEKGATLMWFPENAGLSETEDLGYTFGQYIRQYRNEAGSKVKETGRYMTIWRKQKDGSYQIEAMSQDVKI